MRRSVALLLMVAPLLVLGGLPAPGASQISLAPKVGTLGLGADLGLAFGSFITLRAGYGTVPTELDADISDVSYEADLPDVILLGVDLHPGGGGFRVSGGVLIQTDDVILDATPSEELDLGDNTYSPSEIGTLRGVGTTDSAFPFAMIGFGHHGGRGFGVFLDLGIGFMRPDIVLTANGSGGEDLVADLVLEKEELEDDLRFWPIVQVGVTLGLGGSHRSRRVP